MLDRGLSERLGRQEAETLTAMRQRQTDRPAFKAPVELAGVRGLRTANELGQEDRVQPLPVGPWPPERVARAKTLCAGRRGPTAVAEHRAVARRYGALGRLQRALDGLKNIWAEPLTRRRGGVGRAAPWAPSRPGGRGSRGRGGTRSARRRWSARRTGGEVV